MKKSTALCMIFLTLLLCSLGLIGCNTQTKTFEDIGFAECADETKISSITITSSSRKRVSVTDATTLKSLASLFSQERLGKAARSKINDMQKKDGNVSYWLTVTTKDNKEISLSLAANDLIFVDDKWYASNLSIKNGLDEMKDTLSWVDF